MSKKAHRNKIVGNTVLVDDFLGDILEASSEYSIIGSDLKEKSFPGMKGHVGCTATIPGKSTANPPRFYILPKT